MKIAITIIALVVVGVVLYAYFRSKKQPTLDEIYAELKALPPVAKTAEALLLSFRTHTTADWPDFKGLESFFTKREPYSDKIVVITEVCRFPDHEFSTEHLLVTETANGWRVLHSVSK